MRAPVPGRRRAARDAGMVTAELAVALPALLVVLAGALWALLAVAGQMRCVDAARVGARLAARGESAAVVRAAAERAAPPGARVRLDTGAGPAGEEVRVEVSAQVNPFGASWRRLPALPVRAAATALREDR